FRLFPDTGSGHVLALSRLMWRVVHVDGDRVTLWAAGAYRNSQFHLAGDIPVYLKSHLRQNLLSDFTGLGLLNHIQLHSVCSGVYDHIWVPTLAEVNGWDLTVAQRSFDPNGFWQNAWLRSHQGTQFPNNAHIILGQAGVASSAHGILWCAVRPALHLSLGALVAA
ncbi:MAG: hypothetical protein FWE38_01135, partial [Firmicutes bacterium]|nr:hypothetical protein [Bacillota bacterium]